MNFTDSFNIVRSIRSACPVSVVLTAEQGDYYYIMHSDLYGVVTVSQYRRTDRDHEKSIHLVSIKGTCSKEIDILERLDWKLKSPGGLIKSIKSKVVEINKILETLKGHGFSIKSTNREPCKESGSGEWFTVMARRITEEDVYFHVFSKNEEEAENLARSGKGAEDLFPDEVNSTLDFDNVQVWPDNDHDFFEVDKDKLRDLGLDDGVDWDKEDKD